MTDADFAAYMKKSTQAAGVSLKVKSKRIIRRVATLI